MLSIPEFITFRGCPSNNLPIFESLPGAVFIQSNNVKRLHSYYLM